MGKRRVDSEKRNRPRNRRPTIGLLTSPIVFEYLPLQMLGVTDVARERDVNLLCFIGGPLRSPHGFETQGNVLYDLVNVERIDGLIIQAGALDWFVDQKEMQDFCRRYHPLPVVSVEAAQEGIPSLLPDYYQGMREAIVHLIEVHGYRRIAFIRGPEGHWGLQERYRAYTETLAEYGLPFDPNLVTPYSDTWDGAAMVSLLLDERKLLPQVDFEAVVSVSDGLAVQALNTLQARGIHVPEDIVLVGYDDVEEGRVVTPPLTTVRPMFYEMGRKAVEMLLALLEGEEVPERVVLPSKLVVRQSCGCLDPLVVLAATGPVVMANESFEVAVVAQREKILSEMIQAVGTSIVGLDPVWAERLLDAFIATLKAELDGETSGVFLATLDDVLRQVVAVGGDVATWQNVLSVLRRYLLPYFGDAETLSRVEDLWGQAGVIVGETAHRIRAYRRLQAERQAQTLREIGQALITTFDVKELMNVLAQELPHLGIPSAYLSLYEDPKLPAGSSSLILAYDEKGRVELEPGGQVFPTRQLVPDGVLPQERLYSMVVLPLYFREDQIGFVLFEMGLSEGSVYDVLRGEISSALRGALLVERRGQTEEAMAKRATELELVAQVSAATSTILDTTELLERVATLARDSFGLYHIHIYLLDEAGETLILAAGAGSVGQQMVAEGWSIPYEQEQSLVARTARTRQGVIVNDVLADPDWLPNPLLPDTRSEMAVPLLVRERVLGVLDVQADAVGRFTEDDIRIQSTLAAQVAVALEKARLFEQGRKNLTLAESLYQAGRRITAARNLQEIVTAVAEVVPVRNINRVVLCGFEYDAEEELERMIVQANWHSGEGTPPMLVETRYPRAMYPGIEQFLGSEPMIFGDIQHDKRFGAMMQKMFQRLNIRAMTALPLWTGTRQMGVLLLQAEEVYKLSEEEIRSYMSLMGQVAVAVENQRLLAETSAALAEVEATQRHYTVQAWEAYWARHEGTMRYEETREGIVPPGEGLPSEVSQAVAEKQTVVVSAPAVAPLANGEEAGELLLRDKGTEQAATGEVQSSLVVPLTVRDEVIGVLGLQEGDKREWAPEEIALVEAIGEQLTQAMENLRLIDETQQRVAHEAQIYEIGQKIQGAQSLEEALQVAIREVGQSLKAPQTAVQLKVLD